MQNAPETTALVPLDGAGASGIPARPRPHAAFVAQLIACITDCPDYRARRRAEPEIAAASYGGGPAPGPRRFERFL